MKNFSTVDEYIRAQPAEHQPLLRQIRAIIREIAPDAAEGISYSMPAYKYLGKPLVYFMCAKKHIGFYPTPSWVEKFSKELSAYKTSKGAIQFPQGQAFPLELIKKIVEFRVWENRAKLKL